MAKKPKNDTPPAEAGHNSGVDDRTNQALFLDHIGKIQGDTTKKDKAVTDLRNSYKRAKADGFSKKDIDYAISLMKDEDGKALEQRKREEQIARWLQHPIGLQGNLFESDGKDRQPIQEKAYNEGFIAGSMGQNMVSPYEGDLEQRWLKGWHAGQGEIKKKFMERNTPGDQVLVRDVPPEAPEDEYADAMEDASAERDAPAEEEGGASFKEQLAEVTGQGEKMQKDYIEKKEQSKLN